MKLDVGNMDMVQTKPDVLPPLKKVLFRVLEPASKEDEHVSFKEGAIKAIQFKVQVDEPTPYIVEMEVNGSMQNVKRDAAGRVLFVKANYFVERNTFLTWKGCTEAGYANKDYLRSLKQVGEALGVDFSTQDVEDAYGKTFRADIIQRKYETQDGSEGIANDLRNFRKSDAK